MVGSGVFTKRDRLHLIKGFLVAKTTDYPPHAVVCVSLGLALQSLFRVGWSSFRTRPDDRGTIPPQPLPGRQDQVRGQIRVIVGPN
jgi:hypothetical protein